MTRLLKIRKPFTFRLIAAGASFKAILLGMLGLWLVSALAGYAAGLAGTLDAPAWLPQVLRAVAYLSSALLALLCLWGLWSLAVRTVKALLPLFVQTEAVDLASDTPLDLGPEAPEIGLVVNDLSRALADLEADSSAASLRLLDAQQCAANLVALIKAISLKAEAMRVEVTQLQNALDAVAGGDPLIIARAAGQVRDEHIRELLLCAAPTPTFWISATRLIATQLGALSQWSNSYDQFIVNLLAEVGSAKSRLVSMSASLELTSAARPLLSIQANLNEAQAYLQTPRRPELALAVKTLPSLSVGLLK